MRPTRADSISFRFAEANQLTALKPVGPLPMVPSFVSTASTFGRERILKRAFVRRNEDHIH